MYDVIVAGVGGMGSAALHHLARRGAKALGLERHDLAHDLGSSHGLTRIIRLAYAEHPAYVPLLRRAYALWRELEADAGEPLLTVTGGLDIGHETGATVTGALAACTLHDLPHERLDAQQVARRFPAYRLAPDMVGIHQPDAGILAPERCIVAHVDGARRAGAHLHTRERVVRWTPEAGGITVDTDRGTYRARRLVVTAGAWAGSLVPAIAPWAAPERQVVLWTEPLAPARFAPAVFPVFNMEAPEGRYYGLPVHGAPGFKIGKYHHRFERVQDPDHLDRTCRPEDEAVLRAGLRRYFPDADGATLAMQACLFTNSPDEHFIVDTLPECPQVVIAAGFSGHGYKFCSAIGEIATELALDGGTRHDIGLFRLSRFV